MGDILDMGPSCSPLQRTLRRWQRPHTALFGTPNPDRQPGSQETARQYPLHPIEGQVSHSRVTVYTASLSLVSTNSQRQRQPPKGSGYQPSRPSPKTLSFRYPPSRKYSQPAPWGKRLKPRRRYQNATPVAVPSQSPALSPRLCRRRN